MSQVATKSLLLSQPKAGQVENPSTPALLTYYSSVGETATEIKVEIPGVDPSSVEVEFEGHTLLVRCERGELTLPLNLSTDTSKITADILWGMLTLSVPLPTPRQQGVSR
jgi:HSP20 family molecular chaperone IbpA